MALRVIAWIGNRADAEVMTDLLAGLGAEVDLCTDQETFFARIHQDADGVIVTDAVLTADMLARVCEAVKTPDAIATIPLLVVASGGMNSPLATGPLHSIENVLFLDRPVHLSSFQMAISAMLRLRKKQLEVARLLEERQQSVDRLTKLSKNLKRSNEDLERFTSVVSHDLREPLRQITLFAELLQRRFGASLQPEAQEFVSYIWDGAKRMQMLINDLLSFSRLGREGDFATVDLQQLLDMAIGNLAVFIKENEARIHVGRLPAVRVNAMLLTQVFQNLISNALKFRKQDVTPEIGVDARPQEGEWLVWVRDNGIGFDPQYAEAIFQVFHRLHSDEQYTGTGIGLAICKRAIELHGGRIWAESKPGQGTTFYFTLPAPDINATAAS